MTTNDRRDECSGISRRTLVKAGLGAVAAPAVLRVLPAKAQSNVIKIGHVSPRTGPLAGQHAGKRGEKDEDQHHRQILDDQPTDRNPSTFGLDQPPLLQRPQ